jgi:endoglucanase
MGGTDAARVQLQNGGTLVATIGMPARYIHSTTSMIHTDDYEQVKAIVKAIVKRLDWETVERIKANV